VDEHQLRNCGISKSAIVAYSCEQMYQLVNQINDYPQFLNWCSSTDILNQKRDLIYQLSQQVIMSVCMI
jgi:ribosome-associated toxin RatA of RatAB toxin-antitoxin module